jgi:hypothetical protein
MAHVQVTIGRNVSKDNPLPQEAWDTFRNELQGLFPRAEKIENTITDGQSVWKNDETGEEYSEECFQVLARYSSMAVLMADMYYNTARRIELIKNEYRQDAIAVMIGTSELW